jgi:hypothetical protein
MHDIRLALGLIGFLSLGIFLGLRRLLKTAPPRALDASAIALVLLMAAYVKYVWGKLWIVNWIPLPSVIILSNWFPLLLSALAAVVWIRMGGEHTDLPDDEDDETEAPETIDASVSPDGHAHARPSSIDQYLIIRRKVMMGLIVGAAIYSVMSFIPLAPPECRDEWAPPPQPPLVWPVCLQTNPSTCSAASSATILNTLGIQTTEQEMAELCLTRNGTTWLGLYHGLSTKLMRTKHKVEFFESDIAKISALAQKHPLLLCCKLSSDAAQQAPEYVTQGGWKPGTAHSVVYFGQVNGRHIIGDPSRGYEVWSDQDLEILWTRQGLQITDVPQQNAG